MIARDQGQGNRINETAVTVNVIDINDNAPSFVGTPYLANVKENAGLGTPVIDVNATDSDSGRFVSVGISGFVLDLNTRIVVYQCLLYIYARLNVLKLIFDSL